MAKLYFRHGTVGSAKTLNLLAVAHNYELQGKRVMVLKPELDTRFGRELVKSRAGLQRRADLLLRADTELDFSRFEGMSCVLVDEAQFVPVPVIEQLRELTWRCGIPVICYGLRTDFRTRAFEGSRRLLELADSIEEIKTTCSLCNAKAILNLKHRDGVPTVDGPVIDLGAEEKYLPACHRCYHEQLEKGRALVAERARVGVASEA
jgi:thymidine kinase